MEPMRLRQRGRSHVLAAEDQTLKEHVMAAGGVFVSEPERFVQPAVHGPDRVAAAGGGLVVAQHGEGTAAPGMPEPVGDRPLAALATDGLHLTASLPPTIGEQPEDELRLSSAAAATPD